MDDNELNQEIEKIVECTETITVTEFMIECFGDLKFYEFVSKLKFICSLYNFLDRNEIREFSNYDKNDFVNLCSKLKQNVREQSIKSLSKNSSHEIDKLINCIKSIHTSYRYVEQFGIHNLQIAKDELKFISVDYNLLDIDEIKNIDSMDKDTIIKLCDELKQRVTEQAFKNLKKSVTN